MLILENIGQSKKYCLDTALLIGLELKYTVYLGILINQIGQKLSDYIGLQKNKTFIDVSFLNLYIASTLCQRVTFFQDSAL